jgi:hypothetical protein
MHRTLVDRFLVVVSSLAIEAARSPNRRAPKNPARRHRLKLETLEERYAPAVYTVTNAADAGDNSLRWAITKVNQDQAAGEIKFHIGNGGTVIISLASPLPEIQYPTKIDGLSQDSKSTAPPIILDGSQVKQARAAGLRVTGGGCSIVGLQIWNFNGNGINLLKKGGNRVEWCYIGTNGLQKFGNEVGIFIDSSDNLVTSRQSGSSARTVISGNRKFGVVISNMDPGYIVKKNTVKRCYIGVTAAGDRDLGNG